MGKLDPSSDECIYHHRYTYQTIAKELEDFCKPIQNFEYLFIIFKRAIRELDVTPYEIKQLKKISYYNSYYKKYCLHVYILCTKYLSEREEVKKTLI